MASNVNIGVKIDVQQIEGVNEFKNEILNVAKKANKIIEAFNQADIDLVNAPDIKIMQNLIEKFKGAVSEFRKLKKSGAGGDEIDQAASEVSDAANEIAKRIENSFKRGSATIRDDLDKEIDKLEQTEVGDSIKEGAKKLEKAGQNVSDDLSRAEKKSENLMAEMGGGDALNSAMKKGDQQTLEIPHPKAKISKEDLEKLEGASEKAEKNLDQGAQTVTKAANQLEDSGHELVNNVSGRAFNGAISEEAQKAAKKVRSAFEGKLSEQAQARKDRGRFSNFEKVSQELDEAFDQIKKDSIDVEAGLKNAAQDIHDNLDEAFSKVKKDSIDSEADLKDAAEAIDKSSETLDTSSNKYKKRLENANLSAAKELNAVLSARAGVRPESYDGVLNQGGRRAGRSGPGGGGGSGSGSGGGGGTTTTTGGGPSFGNLPEDFEEFPEKVDEQLQEVKKSVKRVFGLIPKEAEEALGQINVDELNQVRNEIRKVGSSGRSGLNQIENKIEEFQEQIDEGEGDVAQLEAQVAELRQLENVIQEGLIQPSDKFIKKIDQFKDVGEQVEFMENRVKDLAKRNEQLQDTSAGSLAELKEMGIAAVDLNKDYDNLVKEIDQTIAELERMEDAEDEVLGGKFQEAVEQRRKELSQLQSQLKEDVGAPQFRRQRKELANLQREIKSADESLPKFERTLKELSNQSQRAFERLEKGGDQALLAAKDLKNLGGRAGEARNKIEDHIQALLRLERTTNGLSDEEEQLLSRLQQLQNEFGQLNTSVKKQEGRLNRVQDNVKDSEKTFADYRQELEDSIAKNFKFISAIGLLTSAMFGLQTGFEEVLRESESFGRALTVLRSDTKNLQAVSEELKAASRQAARQFGARIENVNEVLFQLGSAGLKAEESMAGLNQIMKLLVATEGDAQKVTKSVAGIYNVFGDQLARAGNQQLAFKRITDVLSTTYRDHQVELEEVTQGLRFVAATGKQAGFTFEGLTAQLAVLNDNLVKSGQAGRGLQRVLQLFARERDKIQEAFDINIKPQDGVAEQFVSSLEKVREQLGRDISVADFEESFDIFQARGTKSFVTLANNIDEVKQNMDDLKNASGGVTNELNKIRQNQLFRQFQRAKQALLGIVRSGLDPAKTAIGAFLEVLSGVKEVFDLIPFSEYAASIAVIVATVFGAVQAFKAIRNLLVGLAGTVKNSWNNFNIFSGAISRSANASISAADDYQLAANNINRMKNRADSATGSLLGFDQAQRKAAASSAASSGAGGLLGSVGKLNAVLGVVLTIGTVMSLVNQSSQEISENISVTSAKLTDVNSQLEGTDAFVDKMRDLNKVIENSAMSTGAAANEIRSAFRDSSLELTETVDVLSKTNKELVDNFSETVEKLEDQAESLRNIKESEQKEQRNKLFSGIIEKMMEDISNSLDREFDSVRTFLGGDSGSEKIINDFIKVTEAAEEAGGSVDEFVEKAGGQSLDRFFDEGIEGVPGIDELFGPDTSIENIEQNAKKVLSGEKLNITDIKTEAQDNLRPIADAVQTAVDDIASEFESEEQILKRRSQLFDQLESGFERQVAEAMPDASEGEIESKAEELRKLIQRMIKENVFDGLDFEEVDDINIKKQVTGLFAQIQEAASTALPRSEFNAFMSQLKEIEQDAKTTRKAFEPLVKELARLNQESVGVSNLNLGTDRLGEQVFEEIDTSDFEDQFMAKIENVIRQGPSSDAFKQLATKVDKQLGTNIREISDPELAEDRIRNRIRGELRNVFSKSGDFDTINTEEELKSLINLSQDLLNAQGQNSEAASKFFDIYKQNQVKEDLKERKEILRNSAIEFSKQVRQQNSLNSLVQERLDLEEKIQSIKAKEAAGIGIEELQQSVLDANLAIASGTEKVNKQGEAFEENSEKIDKNASKIEKLFNVGEQTKGDLKNIEELIDTSELTEKKVEAAKEYRAKLNNVTNELQKQSFETLQTVSGLEEGVAASDKKAKLAELEARSSVRQLELEDKINDNLLESAKAASEILQNRAEMRKQQEEILDQLAEEEQLLFESLSLSAEILDRDNERAGAQSKILKQMSKIKFAQEDINEANDRFTKEQITQADLSSVQIRKKNEQLQAIENVVSTLENEEEKEEKINEVLDKRLDTLSKIRDLIREQSEELNDQVQNFFEQEVETSPFRSVVDLAQATGRSVASVATDTDSAIEGLKRQLSEGEATLSGLSTETTIFAKAANDAGNRLQRINSRMDAIGRKKIKSAFQTFQKAFESGNIERAQQALDRAESSAEKLFDQPEQRETLISTLEEIQRKRAQIADESVSFSRQIDFAFGDLENKDKLIQEMKDVAKRIREELKQIGGQPFSDFQETLQKVQEGKLAEIRLFRSDKVKKDINDTLGSLDDTINFLMKQFKDFNEKMREVISNLENKFANVEDSQFKVRLNFDSDEVPLQARDVEVEKQKGGKIPGFGGGDTVPAMLEPGEFVMPKESVSQFGTGFFEGIRRESLPGFQTGGLVTGADAKAANLTKDEVDIMDAIIAIESSNAGGFGAVSGLPEIDDDVVGQAFGSIQFTQGASLSTILRKNLNTAPNYVKDIFSGPKKKDKKGNIKKDWTKHNINNIIEAAESSPIRSGNRSDFSKATVNFGSGKKTVHLDDTAIEKRLSKLGQPPSLRADQLELAWDLYGEPMTEFVKNRGFISERLVGMSVSAAVNEGLGNLDDSDVSGAKDDIVRSMKMLTGSNKFLEIALQTIQGNKNIAGKKYEKAMSSILFEEFDVHSGSDRFLPIKSMGLGLGSGERFNNFKRKSLRKIPGLKRPINYLLEEGIISKNKDEEIGKLQKGEAVIPKDVVKSFGEDRIRKFFDIGLDDNTEKDPQASIQKFHSGGIVGGRLGFQEGGSVPKLSEVLNLTKQNKSKKEDGPLPVFLVGADATSGLVTPEDIKELKNSLKDSEKASENISKEANKKVSKDDLRLFKSSKNKEEQLEISKELPVFITGTDAGDAFVSPENIKELHDIGEKNLNTLKEEKSIWEKTADRLSKLRERRVTEEDIRRSGSNIIEDREVVQSLLSATDKFGDTLTNIFSSSFGNAFVPKFAKANAEALQQFQDKSEEITQNYINTVDEAGGKLSRNQSDFFSYIDSVRKAQQKRFKAEVKAQEKLREEIKKTREIIANQIGSALEEFFTSDIVSNVFSGIGKKAFGSIQSNVEKFAGEFQIFSARFAKNNQKFSQSFNKATKKIGQIVRDIPIFGEFLGDLLSLKEEDSELQKIFLEVQKLREDNKTELPDKIAKSINELEQKGDQGINKDRGTLGSVLKRAGDVLESFAAQAFAKISQFITKSIGKIVQLGFDTEQANKFARFISTFADQADAKMDQFLRSFNKVLDAIAKHIPTIIQKLAARLPEIFIKILGKIQEVLPQIIKALANALPDFVKSIIPIIIDFFLTLIKQMPKIIGAVIEAAIGAVGEIIKKLPQIIITVVVSLINTVIEVFKAIGGKSTDTGQAIKPPEFAGGGTVPGNGNDAVPIIAHEGEGVLVPEAVQAMGGPEAIETINKEAQSFAGGGVVGDRKGGEGATLGGYFEVVGDGAETIGVKPESEQTSNNQSQVVNNINVNAKFDGSQDEDQARRNARAFADELDKEMAKKTKDRDSNFADAVNDDG